MLRGLIAIDTNNLLILSADGTKHHGRANLKRMPAGRQNVHLHLAVGHGELDCALVEGKHGADVSNRGNGGIDETLRGQELETEEGVDLTTHKCLDAVEVFAGDFRSAKKVLHLLSTTDEHTVRVWHFSQIHQVFGSTKFANGQTALRGGSGFNIAGRDGIAGVESIRGRAVFANVAGSVKGIDDHVIDCTVECHRVRLDFVARWENDGTEEVLVELIEDSDFFLRTLGEPVFGSVEFTVRRVTFASENVLSFGIVDEVEPFLLAGEIGASNGIEQARIHLLESLGERAFELCWVECINGSHDFGVMR